MKKVWSIKKNNNFNAELIIKELPEIKEYVRLEKFQKSSDNLYDIWQKRFYKPKLITIDINKKIILEDSIYKNGVGDPALAECLRNNQILFYKLLEVAGVKNKKYMEIINKNINITKNAQEKINNWFQSYISQDIKIILNLNSDYYSIRFYEKEIELNFENLSLGTQNLLKIISQIKTFDSQTIIQIDEPETGIHPLMQIQFRDFLEDLSDKTKSRFIIYTHSNYIVKNGVNTLGLHIMVRNNNISKLYTKKEYLEEKNISDIQVFEKIGYESFESNYNFDKSKKIIVVKGETDVIYLRKIIQSLNLNANITTSKIGGATNILKTKILLETVHGFQNDKIILSPDKDIKEKHFNIYKMIKKDNCEYFPLGTEDRKEIEGFFDATDKKYIVSKVEIKKIRQFYFEEKKIFWKNNREF